MIDRIKLGGEGGWDYLNVDGAARRLYVSRGTHVMVVDIDSDTLVGDIPDTPGVHGIALAPELGRGFTSNGKAGTSTIFDLKTLSKIADVKTGDNPDCIIYDPASKNVFTFNGRSGDATAFEALTGSVTATIPLGGKPEYAVSDGAGKVYANLEDKNEVVEIDTAKLAVTKHFPIAPCDGPSGIAMDTAKHIVFSGCHNKMMTALDVSSGAVIATIPIGKGVDANAFDPVTGYALSSNGEGNITVAKQNDKGGFDVIETVETQPSARTMALDKTTHKIYLSAAQYGPMPEPKPGEKHQHPPMVKDSFVILVVGK